MEIIEALSKEDVRHFKLFLKRTNSNVSKAPVSILFDAIRKNKFISDKEIHNKYFSELKRNAFYRLKNRMLTDVNKSLLVLNYDKDDRIMILNYLILSEIFLYKSEYKMAYDFLEKAEKKARKSDFFDLLNTIYEQMILLSRQFFDLPLDDILKKKRANYDQRKKIMEANDMLAEILWRFQKSNYAKQGKDVLEELDNIQKELENIHIIEQSPSLKMQIQVSIRMILYQKGDFSSLNKYLESKLVEFQNDGIFTKSNHAQKIVLLTWLINTNIKLFSFSNVFKHAKQLRNNLDEYNKLYYNTHIWTYYQSMILAFFYSNQLERCLKVLNTYSKDDVIKDFGLHHTNYNVNSALIYFCLNNLKKANTYLDNLLKEEFFEALNDQPKILIKIIELLFYYENGDYKYLDYAIKSAQKKLPSLKDEKFIRHSHFLKILKLLAKDPEMIDLKTINEVDAFINQSPTFEPIGNNEAINFKIWLQSKKLNESYYSLLIEEIGKLSSSTTV